MNLSILELNLSSPLNMDTNFNFVLLKAPLFLQIDIKPYTATFFNQPNQSPNVL
jgi:hypothetical protein